MGKKWLWVIGALIAGALASVMARDSLIGKAVGAGLKQVTGFGAEIGRLRSKPQEGKLVAQDVVIRNPSEFSHRIFCRIPRLEIALEPLSLFRGPTHIGELDLEIAEVHVVRNQNGKSNVEVLNGIVSPKGKTEQKRARYRIDVLRLKIGNIKFRDYSGKSVRKEEIPVNLDSTFHNLDQGTDVNRLVVMAVLSKFEVPGLQINLKHLARGLGEIQDTSGEVIDFFGNQFLQILNKIEKVIPGGDGEHDNP